MQLQENWDQSIPDFELKEIRDLQVVENFLNSFLNSDAGRKSLNNLFGLEDATLPGLDFQLSLFFHKCKCNKSVFYGVFDEKKLIGITEGTPSRLGGKNVISNLAIILESNYQGKALGRNLLKFSIENLLINYDSVNVFILVDNFASVKSVSSLIRYESFEIYYLVDYDSDLKKYVYRYKFTRH